MTATVHDLDAQRPHWQGVTTCRACGRMTAVLDTTDPVNQPVAE